MGRLRTKVAERFSSVANLEDCRCILVCGCLIVLACLSCSMLFLFSPLASLAPVQLNRVVKPFCVGRQRSCSSLLQMRCKNNTSWVSCNSLFCQALIHKKYERMDGVMCFRLNHAERQVRPAPEMVKHMMNYDNICALETRNDVFTQMISNVKQLAVPLCNFLQCKTVRTVFFFFLITLFCVFMVF